MRQEEKYMLNEGVLLWAYAYAAAGYAAAAVWVGVLAVIIALQSHSIGCLRRRAVLFLWLSLGSLLTVRLSGLLNLLPVLLFLAPVNAAVSVLWMESSERAIAGMRKKIFCLALGFLSAALAMPPAVIAHFAGGSQATLLQVCLFVLLIFGPVFLAYLDRCRRRREAFGLKAVPACGTRRSKPANALK